MGAAPEEFLIRYSPRRTRIAFLIRPQDGRLEVRAPTGISRTRLELVVRSNAELIERLREDYRRHRSGCPEFRFEEGGEFFYLGTLFPLRFSRRVLAFDNAFLVPAGPPEAVKESLTRLYRRLALEYLTGRVTCFEEQFALEPRRLKISSASSRWGSCTRDGNISFTWKLIQCPAPVVDYVVIHELAHLLELNHSARFWNHVARMCPDFRRHRRFLTENALRYSGG